MKSFVQFRRAAKLNVQGRVLQGLDFEFQVVRSTKASQNTCEIKVYNFNPDNRKFLQSQTQGVVLELHAGYAEQDPLPRIFLGQLRQVTTERQGPDWVTLISSGDGDKEKKKGVSFSLGPGTSYERAVQEIVKQIGGKAGNVLSAIKNGRFADAGSQLSEGFTAHGNGDEELKKLMDSGGFEHSWQNGELQVLPKGGALNLAAITLDETSGLIGSPELGVTAAKGGATVKFRALLNGEIFPGRVVHVKSVNVDGFFAVTKAQYTGMTWGNDWYVDCEAKAYGKGASASLGTSATADAAAKKNPYAAVVPGNIDLAHRPYVRNADNSISTVRSASIEADGKIYLFPTVTYEGKILGAPDAFRYYVVQRKQHLGIYASEAAASAAGEKIHQDQLSNPPANTLNNGLGPKDLE